MRLPVLQRKRADKPRPECPRGCNREAAVPVRGVRAHLFRQVAASGPLEDAHRREAVQVQLLRHWLPDQLQDEASREVSLQRQAVRLQPVRQDLSQAGALEDTPQQCPRWRPAVLKPRLRLPPAPLLDSVGNMLVEIALV